MWGTPVLYTLPWKAGFCEHVMNFQVPQESRNFLTSHVAVSFLRSILLHVVSYLVLSSCIQKIFTIKTLTFSYGIPPPPPNVMVKWFALLLCVW